MAKEIKYSNTDIAIATILSTHPEGLTGAEVNALAEDGVEFKPAHFTSAVTKGLIEVLGKTEVTKPTNRKVYTYTFVTDEAASRNGKACNYSDSEKAILSTAKLMIGPFTLAELAIAMGVERVLPGSVSGLVNKGNLAKCGEDERVTVSVNGKSKVNLYGFVRLPQ